MKKIFLLFCLTLSVGCLFAQSLFVTDPDPLPYKEHIVRLNQAHYTPATASKDGARTTAGGSLIFDTAAWAHVIDSTWGAGMADSAKLNLFNMYWAQLDSFYACFVGLPAYNWDSIISTMDTEIAAGVSRGRFAGMLGALMNLVNDGHSSFYDYVVSYGSSVYPGKPVFRAESGIFGACITAINDTTAMVYSADPGHPFGLQPGDVILGYNGISWNSLVKVILRHQLPQAQFIGSTDKATLHKYIQCAGENWYLFDTINIKKCNGTLVNYPTSLMLGHTFTEFCTEQMPVNGVYKMTYADYVLHHRIISSGVVSGTRIGYVYMYDCTDNSGDSLYNAVKTLVEDSLVHGLILDIRTNYGGSIGAFLKTFMYLNNGYVSWFGAGDRVNKTNRLLMYDNPTSWYDVYDTDAHYWNKPIAILCGPGAISSGDILSVLFKHDPYVRTFGLNTAGAFGAYNALTFPFPDYHTSMQVYDFYAASDPSFYLSHHPYPVDSTFWFRQDSVCDGTDNIAATAINWIQSTLAIKELSVDNASVDVFPNPAKDHITISATNVNAPQVQIRITDIAGRTLISKSIKDVKNFSLFLSINGLSGGMYFAIINVGEQQVVRKFVKE